MSNIAMADMKTDIILPDIVFVLPEYDVITGLFTIIYHVYYDLGHIQRRPPRSGEPCLSPEFGHMTNESKNI